MLQSRTCSFRESHEFCEKNTICFLKREVEEQKTSPYNQYRSNIIQSSEAEKLK